jgi:hypothetical protein
MIKNMAKKRRKPIKRSFPNTQKGMSKALKLYKQKKKAGKSPHYRDTYNGKKMEVRYYK